MTWGEIKLATEQKLFSADGTTLVNDETTRDYIAAMPQAANEALQLIITQNIYMRKSAQLDLEPVTSSMRRIDLEETCPDFYRVGYPELYKLDVDGGIEVMEGFNIQSGRYLILPADWTGTFEVWYDAWPVKLDNTTPDDYELPLDDEVAVILPLYMASQLYKDDDNSIATIYRNEFEVAREGLTPKYAGIESSDWSSLSGWSS